MTGRMLGMVGVVVAVLPGMAVSCRSTVQDARHCANNDGDRHCAEQYPDGSRPYCELGEGACISPDTAFGCVAQRPVDECYSPCGGSVLAENGECLMGESSSGSSSGGTETEGSSGSDSSSTTGPVPCMGNEDCADEGAPFCEPGSGECVACDGVEDPDGACAGKEPGLPVCAGGACVQCTADKAGACGGKTPVCDEGTNTCVPCTAHDQCGGAACNLFTGACLPVDAVVHVGGPKSDYPMLQAAVDSFAAEMEGTIIVHAGTYNEAVTVSGGRVIGLLAASGELPEWLRTMDPNAPQLTVGVGTTVLLDGLQLSGNDSSDDAAVLINGGRAWLDRSRVIGNPGGGIVAQSNAELVLRNCFVGGSVNGVAALVINDATAAVGYTTIIGGLGSLAEGLSCTSGATVSVADSIVLLQSDNPAVTCDPAIFDHSASEVVLPGTANENVGSFDDLSDWFTNVATGDFALSMTGAVVFADIAVWQAGDPPTDIDGDPRPTTDGTSDYAGGDVPVAAAQPELDR